MRPVTLKGAFSSPYTLKMRAVQWLREDYGALDDASRAVVDRILSGTGCDRLVA